MGFRTVALARIAVLAALACLAAAGGAQGAPLETCQGLTATVVGTAGDDVLRGTPGDDVIDAGAGNDVVFGNDGNDTICGGDGDDTLFGGSGNDALDGGAGGDGMVGGTGDDRLVGGDGNDLVAFLDTPGPENANLTTGIATGADGTDTLSGVESLVGTQFDDTLTGDANGNVFAGLGGNDTIDGGAGLDGLTLLFSDAPVSVNLATGTATGEGTDRLISIDGLSGSNFDDTLIGSDGINFIDGGSGSDTISGLGDTDLLLGDSSTAKTPGNDRIDGGAGDDFLEPSPGNDVLDGGPGRLDRLDLALAPAGVKANLATGEVTGYGKATIRNVEGIFGSPFGDTLIGSKGPDILSGGAGDDLLLGGAGDDFLEGGAGTNTFIGGPGTDYCLDGRGRSCELSGVPGSSRTAGGGRVGRNLAATGSELRALEHPLARRPAVPASSAAVAGDNTQLGDAACTGSTGARATQGTRGSTARRVASLGAPHNVHPPPPKHRPHLTSPFVPVWLQGSASLNPAAPTLTWQGTLLRFDPKRHAWVTYLQTSLLRGQLDPSGAAIWTDARGRPVDTFTRALPKGTFAWKARLGFADGQSLFDWAEPHSDYSRASGVFAPSCSFR